MALCGCSGLAQNKHFILAAQLSHLRNWTGERVGKMRNKGSMRREDYTILVDSPSPKPPTSHDNNGQGVRVGEAMRRVVKKTLGGQTSTASDAVDSFYYLKILYLKQGHVGYYSHIDFFLMEVNATKSRSCCFRRRNATFAASRNLNHIDILFDVSRCRYKTSVSPEFLETGVDYK